MVKAADPVPGEGLGLEWWSDGEPAIRRVRSVRGFRYIDPNGEPVGRATVDRIRRLAIPPAWTDVRICPREDGYLQATGRDARGRKQYRYHREWRSAREDAKFRDLLVFGQALPDIRARVEADLRRPGMPFEKVLALVVRLLDVTQARVGNEQYARDNRTFGLTTLANRHAAIDGSEIRLRFRGKAGRFHELRVRDHRLAALVRRCRELPGRHLFEYLDDDGEVRAVRSDDVNAYLRAAAGADVTAKMFRTWAATVLATRLLAEAEPPGRALPASRRAVRAAVDAVADRLGNTPAVARSSYIHPAVPAAFARGALEGQTRGVGARRPSLARAGRGSRRTRQPRSSSCRHWTSRKAGRRMQVPALTLATLGFCVAADSRQDPEEESSPCPSPRVDSVRQPQPQPPPRRTKLWGAARPRTTPPRERRSARAGSR